jgi:hypothetical protein
MNWNDLLLRLRALVFRKQLDRELEDELEFHIEMQTQKNRAAGMSPTEAQREARIQFGGTVRVTEECRDVRGVTMITTLFHDIRFALRGFRRTPTFVLTVVVAIGLGSVSMQRFLPSSMPTTSGPYLYVSHIRYMSFPGGIDLAMIICLVGRSIRNSSGVIQHFRKLSHTSVQRSC